MGLRDWLARLRPPPGRVLDPDQPFDLTPGNVRVWDVFLEIGRNGRIRVDDRDVDVRDLPITLQRYELARADAPGAAVVRVVPTPDVEFRRGHETYCESVCTPLVPFDFEGIALAGPRRVPVAESIANDWEDGGWVQNKVARFVVAGRYRFGATTLAALGREPMEAIDLVIENGATGESTCINVDYLIATYRYQVIGISESPMRPPDPWRPPEGITAMGGYFHAPLGLYAGEPDAPFELRVRAECAEFRSETITILLEP